MGLSASQARLLTITARKSDCEFQSMRYSHEKIALSRSMTDISNEYQNALSKTKLVYDFYGNGDTTTPVSYGLFMTPSEINGYMPILTTNPQNRIVLNSKFAAVARAAGIPQEGLGSLPSSDVRNNFISALADQGIITAETANMCKKIAYSQAIGVGTIDLVVDRPMTYTLDSLLDAFSEYGARFSVGASFSNDANVRKSNNVGSMSARDLFYGNCWQYSLGPRNGEDTSWSANMLTDGTTGDIFDATRSLVSQITSITEEIFAGASQTDVIWQALEEANTKINACIGLKDSPRAYGYAYWNADGTKSGTTMEETCKRLETHVGYQNVVGFVGEHGYKKDWSNNGLGINYSNLFKAYLTFIAEEYEKLTYGDSNYKCHCPIKTDGKVREDYFGGNYPKKYIDNNFALTYTTAQGINTDEALISGYWDALLNQLCACGWTENDRVDDNTYLQEMYKSGMYFISKCSDDGFYYQGNYGTNSYVKEIADDDYVAKAEAKYNTEKQRISHKEEIIDLKMKNLDTEISALSTEYDTLKSLISKNIERAIKRYDA